MREKLQSLPIKELQQIAKLNKIRYSGLRKSELVDRLCQLDEETKKQEREEKQRTEEQHMEEQRVAERRTAERRTAERRTAERRMEEQCAAEQRMEEQRAGEQRMEEQRAAEQRMEERLTAELRARERQIKEDLEERIEDVYNPEENDTGVKEGEEKEQPKKPHFSYQSDEETKGILEILTEGYGFIRSENFLPGDGDVYVAPSQIRKFNLKTGDCLEGKLRIRKENERFGALAFLERVNGRPLKEAVTRPDFEDLTPVFPNQRIYLETDRRNLAMRIVDIVSPIGKGQRGMIVAPPKAGKTTLLKEVAKSVTTNYPDIHLIILLIDERPEEVTDIKEAIQGSNVEVVYSTFDELPEHHERVSEMVIERAQRLVEHGQDVMILLDSITRLARAYNLTVAPSGRTLSGGLDPAALHMPKKFFGSARNTREGGSLTILATALVETGSRMDDVVYEEFKGTGNMELVLNRKLSERRVFPAIDLLKSGTRREDLLLTPEEQEASDIIRRVSTQTRQADMLESIMNIFYRTKDNKEFIRQIQHTRL